MNKIDIAKSFTSVVIGAAAAKLTSNMIKADNPQDSFVTHVMKAGTCSLVGTIVADQTKRYSDAMIDKIAARLSRCNTNHK